MNKAQRVFQLYLLVSPSSSISIIIFVVNQTKFCNQCIIHLWSNPGYLLIYILTMDSRINFFSVFNKTSLYLVFIQTLNLFHRELGQMCWHYAEQQLAGKTSSAHVRVNHVIQHPVAIGTVKSVPNKGAKRPVGDAALPCGDSMLLAWSWTEACM